MVGGCCCFFIDTLSLTRDNGRGFGRSARMTRLANSPEGVAPDAGNGPCTPQKQEMLAAFYRQCWKEMTWRRNAGYRTIILGMAYCGILLAVVAFNHQMGPGIRWCLSGIVAAAPVFGGGHLASN